MTREEYPNGVIRLAAGDNMTLTDGQAFSKDVLVGLHGDETKWTEITDEEAARRQAVQEDPELDDAEALEILLGGDGE